MSSTQPNQDTKFYYVNGTYLKNKKEGIRVSPQVTDGPLVDKIDGVSCVYELFTSTVKRQPADNFLGWHESLTAPYKWMTYKEVYEKVLAFGSGLLQFPDLKEKSLSSVGIYASNCPEWLITEFGCWAYGLVAVPLYDTLGEEATKHICNEAELSVVVCDTPERAKKLINSRASAPLLKHLVIISPKEDLENLRSLGGSDINVITFGEVMLRGSANRQEPCSTGEEDLILLCYTSGTTGTPKGAMIRNKNLISVVAGARKIIGNYVTKDDSMLSFLPLAHIYEQFCEIYVTCVGGRIGYFSGDINTMEEDMKVLRPTLFASVPRLMSRVYDYIYSSVSGSAVKEFLLKYALEGKCGTVEKQIYKTNSIWDSLIFSKIRKMFGGNIRLALVSGAPISAPVLRFSRAVFSCPMIEAYGCTETCGPISMAIAGDLNGSHVGSPWPCLEVKLCDVPDMNLVAARDNKGEICVRGASCISGYYKNPEASAKLVDADGWLHTGDVGTWRDGCLKVVDRCKNIFKLAQGEYVAPEKLELLYQQSTLINQIFVDGDAHSTFPIALVVPEVDSLRKALSKNSTKNQNGSAPGKLLSLEEVCADPGAKKLILAELKGISDRANLVGFEKVRNITLIAEPFSVENLMLTPTQKMSRPIIRKKYSVELAKLYKDAPEIQ